MILSSPLIRFSLLTLLIFASSTHAGAIRPFVTNYELIHSGITIATAQFTLNKADNGQLTFRSVTKPAGFAAIFSKEERIETAVLEPHGETLRPLEYSYDRNHTKRERHVHISFDWVNMQARNTAENQSWKMDIPSNVMDKFGVQLALMLDMQDNRRPLDYPIADGGKLKAYRFEVLGKEKIETPSGTFDTVHLLRTRKNSSRTTEVWLAPKHDYLLVQILQIKEGKGSAYMKLKDFTFAEATLP